MAFHILEWPQSDAASTIHVTNTSFHLETNTNSPNTKQQHLVHLKQNSFGICCTNYCVFDRICLTCVFGFHMIENWMCFKPRGHNVILHLPATNCTWPHFLGSHSAVICGPSEQVLTHLSSASCRSCDVAKHCLNV